MGMVIGFSKTFPEELSGSIAIVFLSSGVYTWKKGRGIKSGESLLEIQMDSPVKGNLRRIKGSLARLRFVKQWSRLRVFIRSPSSKMYFL